jgi:hypothetical protein
MVNILYQVEWLGTYVVYYMNTTKLTCTIHYVVSWNTFVPSQNCSNSGYNELDDIQWYPCFNQCTIWVYSVCRETREHEQTLYSNTLSKSTFLNHKQQVYIYRHLNCKIGRNWVCKLMDFFPLKFSIFINQRDIHTMVFTHTVRVLKIHCLNIIYCNASSINGLSVSFAP